MDEADTDCTKCGEVLTPLIPTVRCGSDCSECGKYRHHADQLFYLYLLTHQQLKLHKIGIGTIGKDKGHLEQFIIEGWTVYGLWHEVDKRKTFQWERAIFEQLKVKHSAKALETPIFLGKSDKHWFESINAQVISVSEIANLITKVIAEN